MLPEEGDGYVLGVTPASTSIALLRAIEELLAAMKEVLDAATLADVQDSFREIGCW